MRKENNTQAQNLRKQRILILVDMRNIVMRCGHRVLANVVDDYYRIKQAVNTVAYVIATNSIAAAAELYSEDFSGVELCCTLVKDRKATWRSALYPPYKADRHTDPDVAAFMDELERCSIAALKTLAGAVVIEVPDCEADDIIAVLCEHPGFDNKVIMSNDKDMAMLINDTTHWMPDEEVLKLPVVITMSGQKVEINDVDTLRALYVLTGQQGKDNVCNVLQSTENKIAGVRSPGFGVKKAFSVLDKYGASKEGLLRWAEDSDVLDTFTRNWELISLTEIVPRIRDHVMLAHATECAAPVNMKEDAVYWLVSEEQVPAIAPNVVEACDTLLEIRYD